jgi:hypothetical protein
MHAMVLKKLGQPSNGRNFPIGNPAGRDPTKGGGLRRLPHGPSCR